MSTDRSRSEVAEMPAAAAGVAITDAAAAARRPGEVRRRV